MANPENQRKLQELSDSYSKLQSDLAQLVSRRQTLSSQLSENTSVQREFESLSADAGVYKLVGPVLVKQERDEAKGTVDGRVRFIGDELKRVEDKIKSTQQEQEGKKLEVLRLQGAIGGGGAPG